MRGTEFLAHSSLVTEECIKCGILFAIPKKFQDELRGNHETLFCPKGHRQYYPQMSDKEMLNRKLRTVRGQYDACKLNSKKLNYQARYWKGQVTKIKKAQVGPLDITIRGDS